MREWARRHGMDVGVPLAIVLLGTVEILGLHPPGLVAALAIEWAAGAALVFRRRWPMVVGTVAGIGPNVMPLVGPELNDLSAPILIAGLSVYTVARHVPDLRGLLPLTGLILALMASLALTREGANITDVVFALVLLSPCFVFGRVMRLLADRNRILAEHAALLQRQQESAKREAVAAERTRMARELHDVIAHSVSVMTLQAAVAEDLVHDRPSDAVDALREVQRAGRGALAETGRLLRLLRDHDDELGLAPSDGLADLTGLVAAFQRGGLDVRLTTSGDLADVPGSVGVSAYQIAREMLTNALRHAGDRRVSLRVVRSTEAIELVSDNHVGDSGSAPSGGLGLVGMTERVSVTGGTIAYGEQAGRFHVRVCLPVGATA